MTDFENAALVTFIVLLTRAIMTYNLNLLIPISNVSVERMSIVGSIFVCRSMRICKPLNNVMLFDNKNFIFEKIFPQVTHFSLKYSTYPFNLVQTPDTPCMASVSKNPFQENECEHRLMTINEIINGSVNLFDLSLLSFFLDYF